MDAASLSTAALHLHWQRCERLIRHPSLLRRLPDGGASIHRRHATFCSEIERRAALKSDADDAQEIVQRKIEHEAALQRESEETVAKAKLTEKYKDTRVSVEATVRRMYEGMITESEIQRIIKEVPTNYFLTHAETVEQQKKLALANRKDDLARLRQQASQHSERL